MTPSPKARIRVSRTAGFTLVELLTVVAIIAILAAILFASLGRVRQSARASADTASMRALGQAMLMYAADNKGIINCWFAQSGASATGVDNSFWGRAWPYLRQTQLRTPNSQTLREVANSFISKEIEARRPDLIANNEGINYTIAINNNLSLSTNEDGTRNFQRLQNVPQPAKATYIAIGKFGFWDLVPVDLPATQPSQGIYYPYGDRQTILVNLDGSTHRWGGSNTVTNPQLRSYSR